MATRLRATYTYGIHTGLPQTKRSMYACILEIKGCYWWCPVGESIWRAASLKHKKHEILILFILPLISLSVIYLFILLAIKIGKGNAL